VPLRQRGKCPICASVRIGRCLRSAPALGQYRPEPVAVRQGTLYPPSRRNPALRRGERVTPKSDRRPANRFCRRAGMGVSPAYLFCHRPRGRCMCCPWRRGGMGASVSCGPWRPPWRKEGSGPRCVPVPVIWKAGSRRPDSPPGPMRPSAAAVAEAAAPCPGSAADCGGKSFGGRMTSQAQALQPLAGVKGLAFLGFSTATHPISPATSGATTSRTSGYPCCSYKARVMSSPN